MFGPKTAVFLKKSLALGLFLSTFSNLLQTQEMVQGWLDRQQNLLDQGFGQIDRIDELLNSQALSAEQRETLTAEKQQLLQRLEAGVEDFKAASAQAIELAAPAECQSQTCSHQLSLPLEVEPCNELACQVHDTSSSGLLDQFDILQDRVIGSIDNIVQEMNFFRENLVNSNSLTLDNGAAEPQLEVKRQQMTAWQANENGMVTGGSATIMADKSGDEDCWNVTAEQRRLTPDGTMVTTRDSYQVPTE